MTVDVYEFFKKHPKFNKHIGNDFLLVEYKCPLNVEEFQLWTKSHLITYVISGRKDWITPRQTHCLTAGDTLFVKKGVYSTKQYLDEDYCVMLFFMNDDFIRNFVLQNHLNSNVSNVESEFDGVYKIHSNSSYQTLINSILQYLTMDMPIPPELVELKFKELIYTITLNKNNRTLINVLLDIADHKKANIEQVMINNFQYDLPIDAFAKLSGRSLSSFKRDFNKCFETTPSKWLINRRLDHGKLLLTSTQMNINEICHESGFKNTSHFIKAFKKKYHLPPNQFRKLKASL
ncbi:helix-turn-helix domain-containing protein [Croceitalea marina]|uniref:Helix-turn-helix domain-containing protein n=1 Tax=Croceitalea marina TaxID=1775166 RepID=A0ABW5MXP0_9FLAO